MSLRLPCITGGPGGSAGIHGRPKDVALHYNCFACFHALPCEGQHDLRSYLPCGKLMQSSSYLTHTLTPTEKGQRKKAHEEPHPPSQHKWPPLPPPRPAPPSPCLVEELHLEARLSILASPPPCPAPPLLTL